MLTSPSEPPSELVESRPEGEAKTRYRAILAYDGTAYQGFQRLSHEPTIQAEVERALAQVTGQQVRIIGAARTDTGVHAAGNVIAFDVNWRHEDWKLIKALNATLPTDIAVQGIERAEPGFHPRFDAKSREYEYTVYEAEHRHPLYAHSAWQVRGSLNVPHMNEAAAALIGEHDFATFGAPTQGNVTIRTVYHSAWQAERLNPTARWLHYQVEANGFLHHMVRVVVGAMIDVGLGRWSVVEFTDALRAAERSRARQMAPANGLTLTRVNYPETSLMSSEHGGEDAPLRENGDSFR